MGKYLGKGILLGIYFVICAFFIRAFWPYVTVFRTSFHEILSGTVPVPELPEYLVIALIVFAAVNVVFFAQIFQVISREKKDKDDDD